MPIRTPTIKTIMAQLNIEKPQACAVRWLIDPENSVRDVFDLYGHMHPHNKTRGGTVLKPYADKLLATQWFASGRQPHRDDHMRILDMVMEMHGVEVIELADEDDGSRQTIEYCNTGDQYAPTVFHSERRGMWISTWGDVVTLAEQGGSRLLEAREVG